MIIFFVDREKALIVTSRMKKLYHYEVSCPRLLETFSIPNLFISFKRLKVMDALWALAISHTYSCQCQSQGRLECSIEFDSSAVAVTSKHISKSVPLFSTPSINTHTLITTPCWAHGLDEQLCVAAMPTACCR